MKSQIEILVHATENKYKIISSIIQTLSISTEFNEIEYEGHWGNKILRLIAEIKKKDTQHLLTNILGSLSYINKQNILSNLENHIDQKGNIYIRLDKQKLCTKTISITEIDGIKIKFKPNKNLLIQAKKSNKINQEIYMLYRRLLESS